jgi:hypothetical protein
MVCHVSIDNGICLLEIVLVSLNRTISAHWNEFVQNQWFFVISPNTDGSKYFPRKCGGFFGIKSLLIGSWSTKLVTKITCIHSSSMMLETDGLFDPSRPPENEAYHHCNGQRAITASLLQDLCMAHPAGV